MKEELVKFVTAKLAKDKGFDMISRFGTEASLYDKKGKHIYYSNYGFMYSGLSDGYISAPTQSLLQKWLREKHNLHIEIYIGHDEDKIWWNAEIYKIELGYKFEPMNMEDIVGDSYEEVLELALQKALKLI
jgi:hypothetical protein